MRLKLGAGKRGAEAVTLSLWFMMIGLVLAAFVSCGVVKKTTSDLKGETYEKNHFARDIALTMDALYAAPSDVEFIYSLKNYKFVVQLKNSEVFVKKSPCDKDGSAGIYDYFWSTDKPLSLSVVPLPDENNKKQMVIKFIKKNGDLTVVAENATLEQNVICN